MSPLVAGTLSLLKRLSDAQIAFIVLAVFNIGVGVWVMWHREDPIGLMNVLVGCMLLISARQA